MTSSMTPSVHGADRIRIRAVHEPKVFYETTASDEIASLEVALRSGNPHGAYCMCMGTLIIDAVRGGATTSITLHHGETLRWDGSPGNVPLVSPDAAMDWLSARGITFVREEWEAARRRSEESRSHEQRWREAMPASMLPFHDPSGMHSEPSPECLAALAAEIPNDVDRARRMLVLFGSGAGPWSGFPGYEQMPSHVLLEMPLDTILAAIGEAPDARVREGAARFFSDWWFGKKRKNDRARIPDTLKRLLLEHVESTGDADRKARARSALT